MDFSTKILHFLSSGATAYFWANRLRDRTTRAKTLAGFQSAESGSAPFLIKLSERATAEGDIWLAKKLAIHAADEERHGKIFAHALKQLGGQISDFKHSTAERKKTEGDSKPSPFMANYFRGYTPEDLEAENIDWLVFMGSTYTLELDASKEFEQMTKALPENEPQSRNVKKSILSIARDETRHAAYIKEALHRRLPAKEVELLTLEWRKRKLDAMFATVASMFG